MCGPHHYLGRGAFAPDSAIVCLLLQRDQNASVVGQRRADLSPGSAGRKPKNVPHPRRTPSPLLQGLGSRYTHVSGVSEEVCAFVRFELLQRIGGGSLKCIEGSGGGLSYMRLELGEGIFDRIEVGTVGRQIVEFGAADFNSLPDAGNLVGGQIVHDDDVAMAQGWRQHLLDPGQERFSVHRTVEKHRHNEARKRATADKSDGLPMTVRNSGAAALSFGRPATKARHLRRKAALIDEDQAFGVKIVLAAEPTLARGLHIRARLLAGMGGLFLCVWPCRSRNFQTAVLTTVTARSSRNRSTISSSVVSGASASTPRMKSACASSTAPFGLPCLAGRTSPVARFSRAHAPAVAIPIANRSAA